jgi:hypothetical protein
MGCVSRSPEPGMAPACLACLAVPVAAESTREYWGGPQNSRSGARWQVGFVPCPHADSRPGRVHLPDGRGATGILADSQLGEGTYDCGGMSELRRDATEASSARVVRFSLA